MGSRTLGLRVAATVFGLIALAQLLRLVLRVEVVVGGRSLPFWPNAVALVIAAGLCGWLAWLSYRAAA
jgi:hypothetical protein